MTAPNRLIPSSILRQTRQMMLRLSDVRRNILGDNCNFKSARASMWLLQNLNNAERRYSIQRRKNVKKSGQHGNRSVSYKARKCLPLCKGAYKAYCGIFIIPSLCSIWYRPNRHTSLHKASPNCSHNVRLLEKRTISEVQFSSRQTYAFAQPPAETHTPSP